MSALHAVTFPHHVEVGPGQGGVVNVSVTNTAEVIDSYEVQVFGLDPSWVRVTPAKLKLFPGETGSVEISVNLPDDYPSSKRNVAINVVSDDDPTAFNLSYVELSVAPTAQTSVALDPTMVTAGTSATFGLVVSNDGNAVTRATAFAVDPEDLAEFTFEPPSVVVPPGRDQVIRITAKGGRAWFGQLRPRTFTFGVDAVLTGSITELEEAERAETIGTFLQRPRIGRWLLSLLGLLTAAAVFAAVLSRSFDRVVEEAGVTDEVIDAALANEDEAGAVVPNNPASVSGTIGTSTSDQGLGGAQVEMFVADDPSTPVASAVTDDSGAFTLSNLGAGDYLMKITGVGVEPLWYPAGSVPSEGQVIEVEPGQPQDLPPVAVGGIPVEVSGQIEAENPADLSGATVAVVAEGITDADAIVATTEVGPDGTFSLPAIPSPGAYQLIVAKPGFAIERRELVLAPGEGVGDLELSLQPGNGLIAGSVSDENGQPLGGVTVRAVDGSTAIETVSLTDGAVGTFRVRDLPTPGQYTVTLSRPGYINETRTIALDDAQQIGNLAARLVPSTGSISGRATIGGQPAPGLTVTLTGGDDVLTTAVVSQGASAGAYGFTGLEAPGTYTLTFAGPDVIPQVRVVDLDPFSGVTDIGGIDVALSAESTTVSGVVRDTDNSLEPQATVTLSDGSMTRTFLTADEPAGAFEFTDVAPGAYTLTASRTGTDPVVTLVNVAPSAPPQVLDLQLGVQASLSGSVTGYDSANVTLTVRLFDPALFPNGEPIETTQTDGSGNYEFLSLDAPTVYVVAVYDSASAADPLDSVAIETIPGQDTSVPLFTVSLP